MNICIGGSLLSDKPKLCSPPLEDGAGLPLAPKLDPQDPDYERKDMVEQLNASFRVATPRG
jgi:hypothetical protein